MVNTELIEGLGVADVIDAMTMRFQHRAHVIHLDSPDPTRVLFGPAVTIGFLPVRNDFMDSEKHSLGPAFYRAIGEDDPTGKVLVMASNGHVNTSLGHYTVRGLEGKQHYARWPKLPRPANHETERLK